MGDEVIAAAVSSVGLVDLDTLAVLVGDALYRCGRGLGD